jgi:hypothetical protein
MLMTTFDSRGTAMELVYPNSFFRVGAISFK